MASTNSGLCQASLEIKLKSRSIHSSIAWDRRQGPSFPLQTQLQTTKSTTMPSSRNSTSISRSAKTSSMSKHDSTAEINNLARYEFADNCIYGELEETIHDRILVGICDSLSQNTDSALMLEKAKEAHQAVHEQTFN